MSPPPDLVSRGIDAVLNQRSCLSAVLRIIEENIPEVGGAREPPLGTTPPDPYPPTPPPPFTLLTPFSPPPPT